jgi:hypothetical protein
VQLESNAVRISTHTNTHARDHEHTRMLAVLVYMCNAMVIMTSTLIAIVLLEVLLGELARMQVLQVFSDNMRGAVKKKR